MLWTSFVIRYPYSRLHEISFMRCITQFPKERHVIVRTIVIDSPHDTSRHYTPNTLWNLRMQLMLSSELSSQPRDTLKSTRLHTRATLGLCCLLWCTIITYHRRTYTACFRLRDIVMKDQRKYDFKVIDLQVNTKQRGMNEQREGKGYEMRRWAIKKLRIRKPHGAKGFMKLVWKIHEATRGKGPLSWNWGAPHVKSV